jgi:uncharacterized protein
MPEPIPATFWQAIDQFNQAQFYECHDTLEALWMEALDPSRKFYQGILQIAVACYHLSNRNVRGATILLGEGMGRLNAYQPDYSGIQVSQLMTDSATLLTQLQNLNVSIPKHPLAKDQVTDPATQSTEAQALLQLCIPHIERVDLDSNN